MPLIAALSLDLNGEAGKKFVEFFFSVFAKRKALKGYNHTAYLQPSHWEHTYDVLS